MWRVLLVVAALGCAKKKPRPIIIDATEAAELTKTRDARLAAARAERCTRPPVREPAEGIDASPLLVGLLEPTSEGWRCLDMVAGDAVRTALMTCSPASGCVPKTSLAAQPPQPEVLSACASLYDLISRTAHATEACSPLRAGAGDLLTRPVKLGAIRVAVMVQITPLVARGEIRKAVQHVIDAIRFVDDFGRRATLIGALLSAASLGGLFETLDELVVHPQLTADDARVIARELDGLLATVPAFGDVMRQEIADAGTRVEAAVHDAPLTGSREQDAAVLLLGLERWATGIERACNADLRACVETYQPPALPPGITKRSDLPREIGRGPNDQALREKVIATTATSFGDVREYARKLSYRRFALVTARMQIELRMASVEDCRDPDKRKAKLASWLADDQALVPVINNDAEPTVLPPTWARDPRSNRPPRVLMCIATAK